MDDWTCVICLRHVTSDNCQLIGSCSREFSLALSVLRRETVTKLTGKSVHFKCVEYIERFITLNQYLGRVFGMRDTSGISNRLYGSEMDISQSSDVHVSFHSGTSTPDEGVNTSKRVSSESDIPRASRVSAHAQNSTYGNGVIGSMPAKRTQSEDGAAWAVQAEPEKKSQFGRVFRSLSMPATSHCKPRATVQALKLSPRSQRRTLSSSARDGEAVKSGAGSSQPASASAPTSLSRIPKMKRSNVGQGPLITLPKARSVAGSASAGPDKLASAESGTASCPTPKPSSSGPTASKCASDVLRHKDADSKRARPVASRWSAPVYGGDVSHEAASSATSQSQDSTHAESAGHAIDKRWRSTPNISTQSVACNTEFVFQAKRVQIRYSVPENLQNVSDIFQTDSIF